jgi:3-hydroxymyristoyl/3-hydroxydecanoyl-(acyl carrier protein) dehydratase
MSGRTIDAKALEAYLPHRGCNLIPDEVFLDDDRVHAVSRTKIPAGDPRGREIFGRSGPAGSRVWSEAFLVELMALTGVPLLHERLSPLGQVAVFSMISRINFLAHGPLHGEVIGHAAITRDRGGFTVFATHAEIDGKRILEAEVMSGSAVLAQVAQSVTRPLIKHTGGHGIDAGLFAWKMPALRFIDRVIEQDAATGRLVASYHYPTTHPFVPGHFPGAALMMGMSQWTAVVDAAWTARSAFGLSGDVQVTGVIKRDDGSEVLDVRDLVLAVEGGLPRIASTKRLAFREPVRPGDGLLIEVTVKSI